MWRTRLNDGLLQLSQQPLQRNFKFGGFQLALPNGNNLVAKFFKGGFLFGIVGHVAVYFGSPPKGAGFGYYKVFAVAVPVPKAAVNKYGGVVFGQNNIGPAR